MYYKKNLNLAKKLINTQQHNELLKSMIRLANLTREAFKNQDITNLISLRTLISWGRNIEIFQSVKESFILSFYNKIIDEEKIVINELYQRIFGEDL